MAQSPKKGAFLGKLARFVSNPTTDWSTLDSAPPSQFLDAPELPEGTKFSHAEIMAMRHQRRKKNRSIRIKEFGMLRSVRAGKMIPGVMPNFNSEVSEVVATKPADEKTIPITESLSTPVANSQIGFDVNKIDNIEQQMVEQWWDNGGEGGKQVPAPQPAKAEPDLVPKTQMVIEENIAAVPVAQESETIEADASFFEKIPVPAAPPKPPAEPTYATVATADPDSIPVDPAFFEKPITPEVLSELGDAKDPTSDAEQTAAPQDTIEADPALFARPPAQETVTVEHLEPDLAPEPEPKPEPEQKQEQEQETEPVPDPVATLEAAQERVVEQQLATQGAGDAVDTSQADESKQFLHTLPVEEAPYIDDDDTAEENFSADMVDYLALASQVSIEELPESLNEPAILFAQGQDSDVETQLIEQSEALKEAVESDPELGQQEPHPLLTLLDYYRATKQEERFENASLYMVQLLGRSAPQYLSADLGQATRIFSTIGSEFALDGNPSNWSCSAELDLTDVMSLRSQLIGNPAQVLLDWRKLEIILDEAVEPLVDQLRDLSQRKIELLMWGGEHLLAGCKQQIDSEPPLEKNIYTLLWHLRLELVRIMHSQEEFENESLDYCVALEESPPAWIEPKCFYIDADEAVDDDPVMSSPDDTQILESNTKHPLQWQGNMRGSIQKLLSALDGASEAGQECVIDCLQLDRIDSIATTELLAWLMAQKATQKSIQFINVNRLVAVFWRIMGIHAQADIELRRD